jgi:threonylcarbamoyladenosine tRNA methylthiotransferase CDKAL1
MINYITSEFPKCFSFMKHLHVKILKYVRKNASKRMTKIHRQISKNSLYHVRISNGCMGNCAYCGIRKAVGPQKSIPINEIITKFKLGLNKGNKDILLVAEDTGPYGLDMDSSLPELLEKLIEISDEFSITITSISPGYIVKYIDQLEEIFKTKKIININISVLSGSERILDLMNKYSDIEKIKNAILRFKKSFQKLELEAQLMIGFPTETEEDFENTLDIIKKLNFDIIFIFKFPNAIGSVAYNLKPKIKRKEVNLRINRAKIFLEELGYSMVFKKRHTIVFKKEPTSL